MTLRTWQRQRRPPSGTVCVRCHSLLKMVFYVSPAGQSYCGGCYWRRWQSTTTDAQHRKERSFRMPWESRKSRASIVWDEPKTVTGTLRHVEAVAFDDHETKLYTIEVNGVLETAWGGTILDRQLRPTDLNHRIEITYAGKQRSKAGREFHNFEVRVWTDGPDADGGRLPPPEDATLADEPPSGDEAADADVPF